MSEFSNPELHLNSHDQPELERIVKSLSPDYEIWAFGSRVEGKEKEYSDLDLAVKSDKILTLSQLADLRNAFDESNLTIKVDIIDWSSVSEDFRKNIKKNYVVIKKAGSKTV